MGLQEGGGGAMPGDKRMRRQKGSRGATVNLEKVVP